MSRGRYEVALVRWRRQKVSAPTALAMATAISDLFGRPSSTVGVALLALRLTTRFPSFQTPQPMTALRLFEIARKAGLGLDELTADLEIYPQKLVNVRVKEKKELTELPSVAREIRLVEEAFGGAGRVVVRFSGTEPLARVMVEGPDLLQVERFTARIAEAIQREMGA